MNWIFFLGAVPAKKPQDPCSDSMNKEHQRPNSSDGGCTIGTAGLTSGSWRDQVFWARKQVDQRANAVLPTRVC